MAERRWIHRSHRCGDRLAVRPPAANWRWQWLVLVGATAVCQGPSAAALEKPVAPPAPAFARLIRVPLPITGNVDGQVKQAAARALEAKRPDGARPVLVFEFVPDQTRFGEGSDFYRASSLAEFLAGRELGDAKTLAFVPKSIKGHAVLAALACEELVMAPEATIGEAGADLKGDARPDDGMLATYRSVANRRRTVPAEVAAGMLDKNLEVLRVETEVSPEFIFRGDLEKLKQKHAVQAERVLIPPGELGRFTGREARELGFVKYLAADRAALAKALGVASESLEVDPSLGGKWRGVRVALRGAIQPQLTDRVQKLIDTQVRDYDVNFVLLSIHSPGGSLEGSLNLANFLARLDPNRVRTVAYVSEEARSDAALVALACDHVILQRGAVLGGNGASNPTADELRTARETIRESLGRKKSRSWSLPVAVVDPSLQVYAYTHRAKGLTEYWCEEEAKEANDAEDWQRGEAVGTPGSPLRLVDERAVTLRLARQVVESEHDLQRIYGLEKHLAQVEPGWADFLIDALASPGAQWLLIVIGFVALWTELHSPGVGVGGFVAGVAFLLYFWSAFLGGTANWLEVVLFLAGVLCILLEVFVVPGVGIFGLGGGLMVLASLVLASQTFIIPHNDYQVEQLRNSLLGLVAAGVALVGVGAVLRRYLPRTPMLGHMMLAPPSESELEDLAHREALADFAYLLGRRGRTTTQLTPSGKARFGSELVDVISEGDVVERGVEVEVVETTANRVVVRPVV